MEWTVDWGGSHRLEPIDRDGVGTAFHGEGEEFIIVFDHRERIIIWRLQAARVSWAGNACCR